MAISVARQAAFEILRRVEGGGAYASDLLHTALQEVANPADAALATEITLGVLRWRGLLDFLLQRHLERPLGRLDGSVLVALRMGLYQLRFLDRVPARAAISESVELTKTARKRSAAGLVNAVLRRAEGEAKHSETEIERLLPASAPPAERLGVLYSHPAWLVERWLQRFGAEKTRSLLEKNNRPPQTHCAVLQSENVVAVADSLRREGFRVEEGRWLKSALAIAGGNPARSSAFLKGEIAIQDEASQMIPALLEARPGDVVLDLCAAPGGKTANLARAVWPGGVVIAADVHPHRLAAAREQMARTATRNVHWIGLDASRPLPFGRAFERILADAPCSGTGTLARNPEIKWRLQAADLEKARRLQAAIVRQALERLSAGGRLVYATCSLEPEENEELIGETLSEHAQVRIVCAKQSLQKALRNPAAAADFFDRQGYFRTFPPDSGTDGFFAAVLERTK